MFTMFNDAWSNHWWSSRKGRPNLFIRGRSRLTTRSKHYRRHTNWIYKKRFRRLLPGWQPMSIRRFIDSLYKEGDRPITDGGTLGNTIDYEVLGNDSVKIYSPKLNTRPCNNSVVLKQSSHTYGAIFPQDLFRFIAWRQRASFRDDSRLFFSFYQLRFFDVFIFRRIP